MSSTRWTARQSFGWSPILTFTRRRLDLLDWFEEHVPIVGFTEDEEHVGVAVTRAERLTISRRGMDLELLAPEASADGVADAVAGVFEVLNPTQLVPALYLGAWSSPLAGKYEEACEALAERATGGTGLGDAVAHDTALMIDLRAPGGRGQMEYGVVNRGELTTRLENPDHGRIARYEMMTRPAAQRVDSSQLDLVSLFFDVRWVATDARPKDPAAVSAVVNETEDQVRRLVEALGDGV